MNVTDMSGVVPSGHVRAAVQRLYAVWPWLLAIAIVLVLPWIFSAGHQITLMSQMGVMIVFALSYNMLLGNLGLLSFGHAVYFGLGGFVAMHVLRTVSDAGIAIPIEAIPLVGAVAGLGFGILFGAVSTRRAGVVFAMISLGLGELVHSSSHMFTGFFGGESGLFGDREAIGSLLGIQYGPNRNVYYLVAFWMFVAAIAMYLLRKTPLGWMANAVRDNPERAQFVGYNPVMVRFIQFSLAAMFAGLAGGLFILVDEIITAETVSMVMSGEVLLSAYIGGIGHFIGPVVGAVLVVLLENELSVITDAWMLYFGILFIAVVMFAPQGVYGVIYDQYLLWRAGRFRNSIVQRLYAAMCALVAIVGAVGLVELAYHYFRSWDPSRPMTLGWTTVDATTFTPWVVCAALVVIGGVAFFLHARPAVRRAMDSTPGGES